MQEINKIIYCICHNYNSDYPNLEKIQLENTHLIPKLNIGETYFTKKEQYKVLDIIKTINAPTIVVLIIKRNKYRIYK